MTMRPAFVILAGAALVAAGGYVAASRYGPDLSDRLETAASDAIATQGVSSVKAVFLNRLGDPTRHPTLEGGAGLDDERREAIARAVAAVPGVGGVNWEDRSIHVTAGERQYEPLHCQEDVDGLLRSRSIRFAEGSAALLPASQVLIDEVAGALRPCLGAIIAIDGHTDTSGSEPDNLALSLDRARAVREALIRRGIPRAGLRARGLGSSEPVENLAPSDPANRRIEFSVIRTKPLHPTPIDTPGPR